MASVSIIDTDGTGDYTTISAWIAAKAGVLSGVTEGQCRGADLLTETAQIDITGFSSNSAANYVKLTVLTGSRHNGVPGAGFRVTVSSGNYVLINREAYTRVEYLELYGGLEGALYPDVGGATNVQVSYCLAKGGNSGVYYSEAAGSVTFINCIAYDGIQGFALIAAGAWTLYNCTTVDITNVGYRLNDASGTMVVMNCIGYNSTNYDFLETAGMMTTSYCLSKDATADDNGATGAQINKTLTFNNAAANDFRLASTDTDAINNGVDTPKTIFTDDIDGTARPVGAWDIGADEYAAADSSVVPQAMSYYRRLRSV